MKTTQGLIVEAIQSKAPRIIALVALAALALVALPGCKGRARTAADVDLTGIYNLVSVDGKILPCKLSHAGADMTIISGVFTINTNGTCLSLMNLSVPSRENISREVKATYAQEGDQLIMKWEQAGTTVGKVDGNTFTMTNEGMLLTYKK